MSKVSPDSVLALLRQAAELARAAGVDDTAIESVVVEDGPTRQELLQVLHLAEVERHTHHCARGMVYAGQDCGCGCPRAPEHHTMNPPPGGWKMDDSARLYSALTMLSSAAEGFRVGACGLRLPEWQAWASSKARLSRALHRAHEALGFYNLRHPIETLPEEREGDVLVFLPGSAVGRGWGPQVKQISPTDEVWGSWTTWCPLPPLAPGLSGLEPGKEELEAQAQLADELLAELIAEEEAVANLRPMLVEGWEMPKPPEPRLEAAAWRVPGVGWVTQWVTHFGGSTPHEIPSPFRDGVRPTVEMFRALGFVTYE